MSWLQSWFRRDNRAQLFRAVEVLRLSENDILLVRADRTRIAELKAIEKNLTEALKGRCRRVIVVPSTYTFHVIPGAS